MIKLNVLYPKSTESQFDIDYFLKVHVPLVKERLIPMGLKNIDIEEGLVGPTPDVPPAYALIGSLNFETLDQLQQAMNTHSAELIADIPNFTNVQPIMQVSQDR
ncbi:EthD family reductase [Telluribacter sp. SYSU D00476]|uniref:EthD family reductase n=1 Tax=Telluribacter sp. SYSU D00476 TaxID=2811430 RepID=UPI001FF4D3E8|nr:EthD family reductase [Telluribacter sp. SYSU D00476]